MKHIHAELIAKTKEYLEWLESLKEPSDQHLLDDGWIRHTGDVCPVHELDKGCILLADGTELALSEHKYWGKDATILPPHLFITHYKVTKAYDPHAENKALYAKDALVHKEPWLLWEARFGEKCPWADFVASPSWSQYYQYRRKQTKQLVDWSCPLLKGCNTNYGELFDLYQYGAWISSQGRCPSFNLLRLAHTSNWQAYNGEDLNLLHEAGFVVEVKYWSEFSLCYRQAVGTGALDRTKFAAYRVIAIRDGFTDNPEEAS